MGETDSRWPRFWLTVLVVLPTILSLFASFVACLCYYRTRWYLPTAVTVTNVMTKTFPILNQSTAKLIAIIFSYIITCFFTNIRKWTATTAHKNTVINSSRVKRKREAGFHLCYSFLSILFLLLYLGVADVAVVVRLFPSFQIKISRETAFFSWLLRPDHSVMGKPNKRVFTRARLYEPALQIGLGFQSFLFKLHDGTKTAGPPTQYQANKSLLLQEKGAAISTHRSGSI